MRSFIRYLHCKRTSRSDDSIIQGTNLRGLLGLIVQLRVMSLDSDKYDIKA